MERKGGRAPGKKRKRKRLTALIRHDDCRGWGREGEQERNGKRGKRAKKEKGKNPLPHDIIKWNSLFLSYGVE